MATITREKFKEVYSAMPPGTDPKKVMNDLVARGHQLEGYSPSMKPTSSTVAEGGQPAGGLKTKEGLIGKAEKAALGLAKFVGGEKIGRALGTKIGAKLAETGDYTPEQKAQILQRGEELGVTGREVAGDIGKVALTVGGGAIAKGAGALAKGVQGTSLAAKAARAGIVGAEAAGTGAAFSAAEQASQGKEISGGEVATGALLGGAVPAVGAGLGKIAKGAAQLTEKVPQIQKISQSIKEVTTRSKPLANLVEKSRKRGFNVIDDIAKSDVLRGSVDPEGKITTLGKGGALEKYEKMFVKDLESKVGTALKKSGETTKVADIERDLMAKLDKSDIAGSLKTKAKKRIQAEIDAIKAAADKDGNVPLSELNNIKKTLYANLNYNNPKTSRIEKQIANTLKDVIEKNAKSVDVKDINKQLSGHYAVRDFLEKLDGKGVAGTGFTRLAGDVAGQVVGGITGAAAGAAAGGGILGAAIGGNIGQGVGKRIGNLIRGKQFVKTFGKVGEKEATQLAESIANSGDKTKARKILMNFLDKKAGGRVTRDMLVRAGIISSNEDTGSSQNTLR